MTRHAKSTSKKKSLARASRGGKPGIANAANPGFYTAQFTEQEIDLIGAFMADPSLDDEISMQRVLNLRLMTHANAKDTHGGGPPTDVLVKLADALATGTGRVARLLRTKQVLVGNGSDVLANIMAQAAEEVLLQAAETPSLPSTGPQSVAASPMSGRS